MTMTDRHRATVHGLFEKLAAPQPPTLFDIDPAPLPALPYGGTSGWSGSDKNRTQTEANDRNGKTSENQQRTLDELARVATRGLTWRDLSACTGWHHGTASGALSVLHKAGRIDRLEEQRDGCHLYVLPEHVNNRPTQAHRPNVSARLLAQILDELETDLTEGRVALALARVKATRQAMS